MHARYWWKIWPMWGCYGLSAALGLALLAFGLALPPIPVAADTFSPGTSGACPTGTYTVPNGTRYVEIVAIGGTGAGGSSYNANNTGGPGGTGAQVGAVLPVTSGQVLGATVGHNGGVPSSPLSGAFPNGGASPNGEGGGSSIVTSGSTFTCPDNISNSQTYGSVQRDAILVVAGGGGGGGGAEVFGSGGAGGNAGVNADLSGQSGKDGFTNTSADCDEGHGGAGGSAKAAGNGGLGGCGSGIVNGSAGVSVDGGVGGSYANTSLQAGGGGNGGGFGSLGGAGGGAGSSYVAPSVRGGSNGQDTSGKPSVTITPISLPTTTATLSGTTSGNGWYTSAVTVTLTATAGLFPLGDTYYALDNTACSATNATSLAACQKYSAPFSVSNGLHTLTYFSLDGLGLDEAMQTKSFSVTPTTASVSAASIGSGTNPTATAGGSTGVSVSGTGSGVVGAAVYGTNPTTTVPTFKSSDAYVDVTVAGSGLTSLSIKDCNLNGGTTVSWYNGTTWVLASNQTYDAATHCVTITVTGSTSPTLSQLTGTPIAAGSPPSIAATAETADGKAYTAGTWTNQSVTVTFTCSANATATPPSVTLTGEGANQPAKSTCTDGVGQKTTMTFSPIDVDKTPPTCPTSVSPTSLWPPNSKPVAITGTVTAADSLSGVASVVGGAVTSNEALASGDVTGFVINTAFSAPLKLSAIVNIAGQLKATRAGSGSGRIYAQTVTVTDQAGNTNATPCTWTVTVPHDQGASH